VARPTAHHVRSLLLAFLLVGSILAGPIGAAPVAAQESTDCDGYEGSPTQLAVEGSCTDTYEQPDELQDHTSIYSHASTQLASDETFLTLYGNYMEDTEARAWMIMERSVANAYENGSTAAEAKARANENIREYYATKQHNLLEQYNVSIAAYEYMRNESSTAGIEGDVWTSPNVDSENASGLTASHTGFETVTVDLLDGSNKTVHTPMVDVSIDSGSTTLSPTPVPSSATYTWNFDGQPNPRVEFMQQNIRPPDGYTSQLAYIWMDDWTEPWAEIENQADTMQNQTDSFVDATYADFEQGDINSSDLLSRLTLMEELMVEGNNESATFEQQVAALSAMGLSSPNISDTGVMKVDYEHDNATYTNETGLLFASDPPTNSSWETGTQYNASTDFDGAVLFASSTDGYQRSLQGNFTIVEAIDTEGNTVSEITTEETTYEAANTSELLTRLDSLAEQYEELEQYKQGEPTGDGGGIDLPDWEIPGGPEGIFAGLAVILLVIVAIVGFVKP